MSECEVLMRVQFGIVRTTFYGGMRYSSVCSVIVYGCVMQLHFVKHHE